MQWLALFCIRCYQRMISPFVGSCCRFHPSCSEYSLEAFRRFGFFRGLILTLYRILRCQPFSSGGVDNVPHKFLYKQSMKRESHGI